MVQHNRRSRPDGSNRRRIHPRHLPRLLAVNLAVNEGKTGEIRGKFKSNLRRFCFTYVVIHKGFVASEFSRTTWLRCLSDISCSDNGIYADRPFCRGGKIKVRTADDFMHVTDVCQRCPNDTAQTYRLWADSHFDLYAGFAGGFTEQVGRSPPAR